MKSKRKSKRKYSGLLGMLKFCVFLLIVLVLSFFLTNYVFRRTIVRNVSMQETLYDGDNIIMDEIPSHLKNIKRFEIICFKNYTEKELIIKRVIGLPGETVRIKDGIIYIDGEEIRDVKGLSEPKEAGLAASDVVLADDEYFVLGDNRDESIDSRFAEIGNIRQKDIIGKAQLVYFPFNHFKIIK